MNLLVFGAPGVGKGTQAKVISRQLNIPHISTGDILRESVKAQTPMGIKAHELMSRGELVPDDIMLGIIRDTLSGDECSNGFILDGFPRTVNQAVELQKLFGEMKLTDPLLLSFEADPEELIRRLTNRRSCRNCNQIFNILEIEHRNDCPKCGAQNSFYQRSDDEEQVIRRRLEVFRKNTLPVLQYYEEQKNNVIRINAMQMIDTVTQDVIKALTQLR